MRIPRPQLRHVLALLLMVAATPLVWQTARALSAGATPDKSNNPRMVGGVVQPAETCNKAGCHTTLPANGCTGQVEILGLPGCYVAGQTYNLQVKVTDASARRWGFEVGVQYNEANQWAFVSAGTLANAPFARTQLVTSADGQRSFVTHDPASANGDGTFPGLFGAATYDFRWTAPAGAQRQTPVCFYVAGLAADNDQTRAGDCTYNAKVCLQPCGPVKTRSSSWGEVKGFYR